MTGLPLIEGFMPIQMLAEMGIVALLFVGSAYLLEKRLRIKINKLAQASALFISSLLYFTVSYLPAYAFQRSRHICCVGGDRNISMGVCYRRVLEGFLQANTSHT